MYLLAFKIAVIAYVYSVILTEPGMILSEFYKWIESFKLPDWLFKPLIDCYKCVAGQMALWIFFFQPNYNFWNHITFICLTIFFSIIINKIYEWNSNN